VMIVRCWLTRETDNYRRVLEKKAGDLGRIFWGGVARGCNMGRHVSATGVFGQTLGQDQPCCTEVGICAAWIGSAPAGNCCVTGSGRGLRSTQDKPLLSLLLCVYNRF